MVIPIAKSEHKYKALLSVLVHLVIYGITGARDCINQMSNPPRLTRTRRLMLAVIEQSKAILKGSSGRLPLPEHENVEFP